ncbi:MAG: NADH-quinone oxidoreductase subunit NuoE [Deltaproteobacteria bacterium]|nr:NADH-quinone oxidoreductase subunit NuoE [Deltaproteobacteria bacterium]
MAFEFTTENKRRFDEILTRYPVKRAAMLPALWLVQHQAGWISHEAMEYVGKLLDLSPAKVYEVATFYTMFNLKPVGKYHFQVCRTLPCQLVGAESVTEHLQKKLGVKLGETSADGRYTLTEVECLGSCGTGPMLQLNDDYHENLTSEKLDALIASLK